MSDPEDEEARYPCPACGKHLYAWTSARHPVDRSPVVLDHCESCGLIVTRGSAAPDVEAELAALERDGEVIVAPNRESFQGGIGGPGWAGLEPDRRRLHINPRAAKLLLRTRGFELVEARTPFSRRSYALMLLTTINAFTLRDNFVRNARAGRLPRESSRQRLVFALDAVVSALVAIPLAIVALIVELFGSAIGRGGIMRLQVAATAAAGSNPADGPI